jgi:hypothetical protein
LLLDITRNSTADDHGSSSKQTVFAKQVTTSKCGLLIRTWFVVLGEKSKNKENVSCFRVLREQFGEFILKCLHFAGTSEDPNFLVVVTSMAEVGVWVLKHFFGRVKMICEASPTFVTSLQPKMVNTVI